MLGDAGGSRGLSYSPTEDLHQADSAGCSATAAGAEEVAFANAGRGWIMVQAKSLRTEDLIEAMEAGKVYASTGVTLKELVVKNNEIKIEVAKEEQAEYTIEFIGVKNGESESRVIETIHGSEGGFNVTADYVFVRARITSTKLKPNPFQEGDFEMAWTQPVSFIKY